jgi:NAD(P)-dependent dehydrogenase (short-subunit alcohol dehydrogenase family)
VSLQGRVAIVTGSGGGLGRAHALYLAAEGARVVVNDLDSLAAETVVRDIVTAGGEAQAVACSVTDADGMQRVAAGALERWGRIDILVNNAGILRDRSFAKMTIEEFHLVVDVHLMGAVIATKAVWETMRARGHGRIVFTTSSSGMFGNFGQANYGAAKMALVGLMQTLAIEGERHDIRVNCLAPSAATRMTEGILPAASLDLLDPALVSPGLLALVGDDAPSRAILCAGAGHFAAAHVTLTPGRFVGGEGVAAGARVIEQWDAITARDASVVPQRGFEQAEREVASAAAARQER